MPTAVTPEWQQVALYALGAALVLILISRIPVIGRIVRFAVSLALVGLFIFLLVQQAPFQPGLAGLSGSLGLDRQEVVGKEVRIRMAADGHFWANATLNGVKRRMLIDSGATVTTLAVSTAAEAGIDTSGSLVPIVLRTANGVAHAKTGTLGELRLGNVTARDLKVVVSPGIGEINVIGMNFLSKLQSWRVEGRTLVLVPKTAEGSEGGKGEG